MVPCCHHSPTAPTTRGHPIIAATSSPLPPLGHCHRNVAIIKCRCRRATAGSPQPNSFDIHLTGRGKKKISELIYEPTSEALLYQLIISSVGIIASVFVGWNIFCSF
ncbi:hypothetical protein Nepgr_017858 [Nepenthes gracilis]|uniref:Uncharacterized protein n=1 Tax=Nepenthes gracilis TaxID=150966 RepID=A0AAD3XSJ2_NEPGR|nr:hypothetical protein Nepgr_017858 [Nepenthes gracilis]